MANTLLFVGTYTTGSYSEGIYSYVLDERMETVLTSSVQPRCHNPAFMAFHPAVCVAYAADDSIDQGGVYAYRYDGATGRLEFLNHLPLLHAMGTCHIEVTRDGRFLLAAHYYSGHVFVCALREDGSLGEVVCQRQHEGSGPIRDHQDSAHAHHILMDASGGHVAVCELGADKIMLYDFDGETGMLTPNVKQPFVALNPGEGPRHAVLHPNGRWMYVVTELGCKVYVYDYHGEDGSLARKQVVSTLRDGFQGHATAGEILITRDGGHILVTNRWYDSIVSYRVDPMDGSLSGRRFFPCYGGEPRHIALTPDEKHLVICNQDTRNVVICDFDSTEGVIGDIRHEMFVWKPAFAHAMTALEA